MLRVPEYILSSFGNFLSTKGIHLSNNNYYKKWLRYYLDFCQKYGFDFMEQQSLPHFLIKLKEKKQTGTQQKQANDAIHIFYELAGQQVAIRKSVEGLKQYDQRLEVKRSNSKPAIHDNDSSGFEYNRKKANSKVQTG